MADIRALSISGHLLFKYLRKCRKKELKTAASQLDHIRDSGMPYLLGEFTIECYIQSSEVAEMSAMKGVVLLLSPKTGADPVCLNSRYKNNVNGHCNFNYASPEDVAVTRDCCIGEWQQLSMDCKVW